MIGIGDWDRGGIGDWDWKLGIGKGIGIGDWRFVVTFEFDFWLCFSVVTFVCDICL